MLTESLVPHYPEGLAIDGYAATVELSATLGVVLQEVLELA